MAEKDMVTQCSLVDGKHEYVAFIPKPMARLKNKVTIDGKDGTWTVREVYASMTAAEANERSRDHTRQRKASDV